MKFFMLLIALWLTCFVPPAKAQENSTKSNPSIAKEKRTEVIFQTSCSPRVQASFNRGVALLYAFAHEAAKQVFLAVAEADPACAMAYWGAAISRHALFGHPSPKTQQEGSAFASKAETLGSENAREQSYIAAANALFSDIEQKEAASRQLAYEKALARHYRDYPQDQEGAIFYAFSLLANAEPQDEDRRNQKKAEAVLGPIIADRPQHPGALHALLHLYDSPDHASKALHFARTYMKIAPSTPHALHMPAHIFMHLGLWQEAIEANRASEASARSKMGRDSGARLHAMDDLVYLYLQVGEDAKAAAIVNEILAMPPSRAASSQAAYAQAAIPARYVLERRLWKEALSLRVRPTPHPFAEAITYFAFAVGGARSRRPIEAAAALEALRAVQGRLKAANAIEEAERTEAFLQAAAGWIEYAEGKRDRAILHLRAAATIEEGVVRRSGFPENLLPARGLLGDLLLEEGEPQDALKEYERLLMRRPNRFNTLYGAARAAERAEDIGKARDYYRRLVALAGQNKSREREILEATLFLKKSAQKTKIGE